LIGKEVSHYRITEQLGSGGMGVVYKAEDTKLKRTVALKFLPPQLSADPAAKERFVHEAQAASALDHPNICTIHEIGETDDGQSFIAMACYDGVSLRDRMSGVDDVGARHAVPISVDESINIAIQIAQGLQKAHEKGIIHRDIKPANIMITTDGTAKILDFGLAKLAGQTRLTKTGSTVGTAAYMSPEQAKGDPVDQRTDIWSLGVMLYEMVAGELPFKGDYDQAVVYSILNENPEPLSAETPEAMQIIIGKCLEKNPADRYQDISELIDDLERFLEGSSEITKRVVSSKSKLKSILFLTTSVAVVIVFMSYLLIQFDVFKKTGTGKSEWENSIAVLLFDNISNDPDQEYFSEGMTEQIISNLSRLERLKVISRTSVMKYKDTDKTIPEIGKELNVAHVLEGSVRKFGNRIRVTAQLISTEDDFHIWTEDYDREYTDLFTLQDEVSEKIAQSLLQTLSGEEINEIEQNRPKNLGAWEYYSRGRHIYGKFFITGRDTNYLKTAEELLKKAVELDADYAPSYAWLSDIYQTYLHYIASTKEEKEKYLRLEEKYVHDGLKADPTSADIYWAQGGLLLDKGEWRAAFESYMKSIMIEPYNENANFSIGYHYNAMGLHHQAIYYLTRTVEVNPNHVAAYYNLSIGYDALGNLEQAGLVIQKAMEIEPENWFVSWRYSRHLILTNRITEAKKVLNGMNESGRLPEKIKSVLYALNGEREKAIQSYPEEGFPFGKMMIYFIFKMVDEAIEHLNTRNKNNYLLLNHSPLYDFLRSDPRFQDIVDEHKKIYDENMEKYGDINI